MDEWKSKAKIKRAKAQRELERKKLTETLLAPPEISLSQLNPEITLFVVGCTKSKIWAPKTKMRLLTFQRGTPTAVKTS